ncbi:ABC transporter permease subunit [Aquibacillus halophilus]|uniref:ABC transporter permease subunit n=1 Tax=Aquibacillus halophilus TaxID=930132 RepID=A0A6A8DPR7_9BACI|nr:ABC transporter permease [Aquibacillus halophilus]MRH45067.1 ABC transporter permease subunit [Aquibacillus halophilus]
MKFFIISFKDFKVRISDKKGFISLLVMPIILTAILGSALSGMFSGNAFMPHTTVGVVVYSEDNLTRQFLDEVLQGEELKDTISLKTFDSEKSLKAEVKQQKVDVGLLIPLGWGNGLLTGEIRDLKVFADPGQELQSSIIESISTSFIESVTSVSISSRVFSTHLATTASTSAQQFDVEEASTDVTNQLAIIAGTNRQSVVMEEEGKPAISGMQYYSAAMGAMFVLFNATIGAKSIIQERTTETLARLMNGPIRRYSIILGKFLGTLYLSFLQFIVFITSTHFLFGVDWGNNLLQTVVIGLAYSVAVSGLAMIIAGLITEEKTADTVGGIGVQIFALLGGSMIPIAAFPGVLQQLANFTPNKWVLESLVEIMNGTTWNSLILPITILVLTGFVSLVLGSLRMKLR